jgi:CheY-like chemotaxis protein
MWLESELGRGSSFVVELPITPPMAPAGSAERWIRPDWVWREHSFMTDQTGLADAPRRPRLVILDEAGGVRGAMGRYTDAISIIEAGDLSEALEEARDDAAHAVLINSASESDAMAMAAALHDAAPRTPVIVSAVPQPTERALQGGATGYLVKPVSAPDLHRAVKGAAEGARHVLMIDDDPEVLELFARMLQSLDSTLDVAKARSAEQGLRQMLDHPPDLVLLDLVMPGIDGWQLLDQKMQHESIRDIPVVLVTAQDLHDRPLTSGAVKVSTSEGVSLGQLLRLSMEMPKLVIEAT